MLAMALAQVKVGNMSKYLPNKTRLINYFLHYIK